MYRLGMITINAEPCPISPAARGQLRNLLIAVACLPLAGCMVGPNYTPPSRPMPASYGEAAGAGTPDAYGPSDGEVRWWRRFDDVELASLVERAVAANNSLKVAEARVRQARSVRQVAQSLLYPRIGVGAS